MGDRTQTKAGQIMGAIAITFFVSSWAVKAIVEQKSASPWEVGFALTTVYAFYNDPKKALHIGLGAIGRIAGNNEEEINNNTEN